MQTILVTYSHPDYPASQVNRALRAGVQKRLADKSIQVQWQDLYFNYPDFHINIKKEQEALIAHDVLVFQHPLFWYSVPALLKHWIDEVLTEGWAYGPGGNALINKTWAHWITAGGAASAYSETGQNQHTLDALLLPLKQTAALCGCQWASPGVTYSSLTLTEDDVAQEVQRYSQWLESLAVSAAQEARHA